MGMKVIIKTLSISLIFIFWQCSHCVNDTLQQIQSPNNKFRAVLQSRRCGSVEGWAVWLSGKDLSERQVFMARMPPPISVEDVKGGASIRWNGPSILVIRAPSWVKPMKLEKSYGSVMITYEVNPIPYPRG